MSEAAKMKNIEFIRQAMDREILSKNKSHTLMAYFVVDEEACDSTTKEKFLGDNGTGKLQS